MAPLEQLDAEQFAEQKFDLPEGGRWTELVAGQVVTLSPPDDAHGNIVRNLSKALAEYAQQTQRGYACFELGLIVAREPDTVRSPPACYILQGERFAESDNVVTAIRPTLVVEIASTNDRRRPIAERVTNYLDWGVPLVWVIDPHTRQVHVFDLDRNTQTLALGAILTGGELLPNFQYPVAQFFQDPPWW